MGTKLIIVLGIMFLINLGAETVNQQKIITILGIKTKKGKSRIFQKDYRLWMEFETYDNMKGERVFSNIYQGKRNDTLFIIGSKRLYKDSLILIEKHKYNIMGIDSIKRTIVNKKGILVIKKYEEFKSLKKLYQIIILRRYY